MRNLQVGLTIFFTNEKGQEIRTKALIGGEWNQWGGTQEELWEAMPITEKLNEALNENFSEELAEEDETEE